METTRTFSAMLNEHLNYDLLKEEITKRDYLLTKVEKDNNWKSGPLPVPFKGAGASSTSLGQLTASNDIGEDVYVRGEVTSQKEIWGSLIFNHRDLMEHDGSGIKESTFLRILPDSIEDFIENMKQDTSTMLLNGPHLAKVAANTTSAVGAITVDRPERLRVNQKVIVKDANYEIPCYVKQIDMDTGALVVVTTRGGSTFVDFSAQNILAASGKLYIDGAQTVANQFSNLRSMLLSAANGGGSTLYGQSKLAYPYLQAIQVPGSSITSSSILGPIFDGYTKVKQRGKGNPTTVIMSYKNMGTVMKQLETNKGAYNIIQGSEKVSVYGWTEISVLGVKGRLTLVAINEMDDDYMIYMDWSALKFHSNGFFRKRKSPDGKEWYEIRAQDGYKYIVDLCLFGELVLYRPSRCGIMYGISY